MKIYYDNKLFRGYSGLCESVFCAPFEDPIKFTEEEFENDRFKELISSGNNLIEFSNIEDCDYVIIPYKWDNYSEITSLIINDAKRHNKKVIALYNDDFPPAVSISAEDGYLFSTTLYKSRMNVNDFSFPAFTGDFYSEDFQFNLNRSVSFCGAITNSIRSYVLSKIDNCNSLKKDIILRSGFWAPELTKIQARKEFIENIKNNTFVLCMCGAGNFSYRLYETMMMGRIPIIIDTDQVFPFENVIDYSEFSIRINLNQIENLCYKLSDIINQLTDDDIINMQKNSRKNWIEYMSPQGWVRNFNKEIKNNLTNVWELEYRI